MIAFERFELENGLKVIVHPDKSTPIVAMNILYDIGARDEKPDKTGFAHLFEHLMFGGSVNIPSFDEALQRVGGDNNAFTSNDITNYYLTLPKNNLETAFWLESDRMLSLAFTPKSLEVQRDVVIEEFKQRYLNQPYGDVWLLLRPLIYKKHPYMWPTIGKEVSHIENATIQDVKNFFFTYYRPNNATMVVAGDIELSQIKELSEKWFAPIERGAVPLRNLPKEEQQTQARFLEVERDVPIDMIYKAYRMCSRGDSAYYATDLVSDILGRGHSSRLYYKLIKERKLFTEINAYVSGDLDEGVLVINGKPKSGVSLETADKGIQEVLQEFKEGILREKELYKVKNKVESSIRFSEMNVLNKAMNLAISDLIEDANLVNTEVNHYMAVTEATIKEVALSVLNESSCSTLYYRAKK